MKNKKKPTFKLWFEKISAAITLNSGRPGAVLTAIAVIVVWAATGPLFHYSDTWQLVINTSTTVITFIMVFVIQHSQNKETTAIQLKLNELIAANEKASNRLVNIEDLTEEELLVLKKFYKRLSELSAKEKDLFSSHSVDEAQDIHNLKSKIPRAKAPTTDGNTT
jgi:low affinity Fe/Cu permease